MNSPLLKFLGWNRPAIDLVADRLLELNERKPDVFRRATIVVPTAESGRRLREYLAERSNRPLLTPRFILPGQLIPSDGAASQLETLGAWLHVLVGSGQFSDKSPAWLLGVASQMQNVRTQLEQEWKLPDLDDQISSFAKENLGSHWEKSSHYEQGRWDQLRALFLAVDSQLESWGYRPAEKVRLEYIRNFHIQGKPSLLIFACIPEIFPINRFFLEMFMEQGGSVEIWVNAPESLRDKFTSMGMPDPVYWSKCPIELPAAPGAEPPLHVVPDAAALRYVLPPLAAGLSSEDMTIACCDSEFSPAVVLSFAPYWALSLPEGRSFLGTEAARIPALLVSVCSSSSDGGDEGLPPAVPMDAFIDLLRNRALQKALGGDRNLSRFNACVDELMQSLFPSTIPYLLQLLEPCEQEDHLWNAPTWKKDRCMDGVVYAREVYQLVLNCIDPASFAVTLRSLASSIESCVDSPLLVSVLRFLAQLMREMASLVDVAALEPAHALLLLQQMVEKSAPGLLDEMDRTATVQDVVGWRELGFDRRHRLVVVGMHEGCVPERPPHDSYLPEAFRSFMGMSSRMNREARDAFLLSALLAGHAPGEVHFVIVKQKKDGSMIAPSSLLLRCADNDMLARRARLLYDDPDTVREPVFYDKLPFIQASSFHAEIGRLEPASLIAPGVNNPYANVQKNYSPSRINDFLHCPLRFWLSTLLGLKPGDAFDENKAELRSNEYGTLLHAVLCDVVGYPAFQSVFPGVDGTMLAARIEEVAVERMEYHFRESFGGMKSPLVQSLELQKKAMKASLQEFAVCHARDLLDGWRPVYLEKELSFSVPLASAPPAKFKLKIDRVDKNVNGGWRIIDYKSGVSLPVESHYGDLKEGKDSPFAILLGDWFDVREFQMKKSKKWVHWKNVQLPIYAYALMIAEDLSEVPELGYYNLPLKKPRNVGYHKLKRVDGGEFDQCELDSAMRTVLSAVQLMRQGLCLYSAETLGLNPSSYDSFGALNQWSDPRHMCGLPDINVSVNNI